MIASIEKQRSSIIKENSIKAIFVACAILSIFTTIGIVIVLFAETTQFFQEIPLLEFLTAQKWNPTMSPAEFGILPLISCTLAFTLTTSLIALPTGLLAAVYLSEYASTRVRSIIKPALEVLAGIPTVVYGYFALIYVTPFLKHTIFPGIKTFNVLSASIVVGIMIIPTIASISEDAMRAVPKSLREAGFGLGVTKFQIVLTVVIPAALSGIVSSFILGISRAIGETMAVTIAAGNYPKLVNFFKPAEVFLEPIQTMTAAMVEIGMSDVSGNSIAYKSLFAVGFTLFIMTMLLNLFSQYIKSKYRERYE